MGLHNEIAHDNSVAPYSTPPMVPHGITDEQTDHQDDGENGIEVHRDLGLVRAGGAGLPYLLTEFHGHFEDVRDAVMDDHENVEDNDGH